MSKARAPYNFIPLPDDKQAPVEGEVITHECYHKGKHTGYFDVKLTTKTPLYIRGMLNKEQLANGIESKDLLDPFMIDDKPVIPGSSLRGMLRNLVEIITFGKMHFVSDRNRIFFRAVAAKKDDPQGKAYKDVLGEPNLKTHAGKNVYAGYLVFQDGSWYIQPAKSFAPDIPFALVSDKEDVVKDVIGLSSLTKGDYHIGKFDVCYQYNHQKNKILRVYTPSSSQIADAVLVCTGNMAETQANSQRVTTGRKNFVLLKKDVENTLLPIANDIIEDYLDGLTPFQRGDNDQSKSYLGEKGILKTRNPVFFIKENDEVRYFGHSPNFRISHTILDNGKRRAISPQDLIPSDLVNPNRTDYADAMFGYVSDDGKVKRNPVAYAGRVSVTSATLIDGQTDVFYDQIHALRRINSTPKPTTFQHYLEQPDVDLTADPSTQKSKLLHYGSKDKRNRIRGHKLYWRQNVTIEQLQRNNSDGSKVNVETTFHPVKEQTEFSFRVYFENLTDAELGALSWALSLDNDPDLYHMLGMAKAYGLGMVKLEPTLILTEREARYTSLFNSDGSWNTGEVEAQIERFIMSFKDKLAENNITFDDDKRIKALKVMLKLYDPDAELFSYMSIEPNEYKERPVLPLPTDVQEAYRAKERERQHQATNALKKRLKKSGLAIGDIIGGKASLQRDKIKFRPKKIKIGKYPYNIDEHTDLDYVAIIIDASPIELDKQMTYAQIIEIIEGDNPDDLIEIICKQVEQ